MKSTAGSPLLDPARIAALQESALLDTPPEDCFDRLTRLAARILHAPASMMTLVDPQRQFIKSSYGLREPWTSTRSTPLAYSFCQHVVVSGAPLLIKDARKHRRVRGSPAIREMSIIAYAGVPLRISEGRLLGAFCAIDHFPRAWVSEEVQVLEELAASAVNQIDLRLTHRRLQRDLEVLCQQAEQFRSLVENTWDIILTLDSSGVIRYVSPSVLEVLGYAPGEIVGRNAARFVHPEDASPAREAFQREIGQPGMSGFLELRLRHASGSWRFFEIRQKVIPDGAGGTLVMVYAHDITERKQAEEALLRSKERFHLVVRATSDIIWERDLVTGEVMWSGDGHRAFRYVEEEMGGRVEWWYERIHPEDRERVISGIHRVLTGVAEFWSDEYRFLRGDGSYTTVLDRGCVARDERGVPVRMIGSMLDVTERRRSQDAQRFLARASAVLDASLDYEESFANLARLTTGSLAEYCLIDLVEENGEIRRAAVAHRNPNQERLLSRDERHPAPADPKSDPVVRVIRTGQPLFVPSLAKGVPEQISDSIEYRNWLQALDTRSLMIVPLVAHERVLGAITLGSAEPGREYEPIDLVFADDLARRAAVALENSLLYRRAQEAVRVRNEAMGVVSHDLRNPLNAILMSAIMLLDASEERRARNVKGLEVIREAAEQMSTMLTDLLDTSSIEAGHFSVSPMHYEIAPLLARVRDLLEPIARSKSIRLDSDLGEGLSTAWIDSDQVLRVFSNLVGNAIKFTPDGGEIHLRAERAGDYVRFSVRDTGPGIPREQMEHVFNRYWQARASDRRGTGLGLAIAKGIVEAHGGRIWAESVPGRGATFFFTVPIIACTDAAPPTG